MVEILKEIEEMMDRLDGKVSESTLIETTTLQRENSEINKLQNQSSITEDR